MKIQNDTGVTYAANTNRYSNTQNAGSKTGRTYKCLLPSWLYSFKRSVFFFEFLLDKFHRKGVASVIRHIPVHAPALRVFGSQVRRKIPLSFIHDLLDPEPGVGYRVNINISDFHFFPS